MNKLTLLNTLIAVAWILIFWDAINNGGSGK